MSGMSQDLNRGCPINDIQLFLNANCWSRDKIMNLVIKGGDLGCSVVQYFDRFVRTYYLHLHICKPTQTPPVQLAVP